MPKIFSHGYLIPLLATIAIILSQCSPKTKSVSVPVDTPNQFSVSGTRVVPDQWWTAFDDQKLNVLVDSALSSNFNLLTAWQRLMAARAVVKRESAALLPDLESSIRGSVDRPKPDFVGGESVRLGLSAVYEVDLWGRIRSRVQAEKYRARASYTDYQAAAISLSAEVVRTWYQLIEASGQLNIIDAQVNANEKMVEMLESRFGNGQVRSVDILRQRQLLESTLEQRAYAESRLSVIQNRMSVLLGHPPVKTAQDSIELADSLPELPALPETGLPIELVRRRPDVQTSFHALQAADRDLASAISNKYPRLSINTSASLRSNNVDNLFENWAYSIGGNLLAPVFYGGELRAEADRNEAVKYQRLYEYGQSVLTAFREVEDALILEQKQREGVDAIEQQLRYAQQSYEQLRILYFNGAGNYLDVLTALGEVQRLRRDWLAANLTLVEYRISLYRALAGSFTTEREQEISLKE